MNKLLVMVLGLVVSIPSFSQSVMTYEQLVSQHVKPETGFIIETIPAGVQYLSPDGTIWGRGDSLASCDIEYEEYTYIVNYTSSLIRNNKTRKLEWDYDFYPSWTPGQRYKISYLQYVIYADGYRSPGDPTVLAHVNKTIERDCWYCTDDWVVKSKVDLDNAIENHEITKIMVPLPRKSFIWENNQNSRQNNSRNIVGL